MTTWMSVKRTCTLILAFASLTCLALAPSASAGPLIAPPAACPGQNSLKASAEAQGQAMRCMTDFARRQAGLASFASASELDASSRSKVLDVLGCDSFSHSACGREFTFWMRETGYIGETCWRVGENLAWGVGQQSTVRSTFQAWMRSPGHRRNILGDYTDLGLSVEVGRLAGRDGTHVWAQHFGTRCAAYPDTGTPAEP
jgi:uncharacterized protein YkwD